MASQQEKVLRVGVIQGGKIVEERVLPARQPITIGTSPGNTFVVPGANLPASVLVFSFHGERYALQFEEGQEGRIQGPKGAADFGALVSQGVARGQGTTCSVPVNDDQRGKIVLGEVTLLWQFVAPPAEVPKPALPKEAKGAHFKSMDTLFVSLLALSFLVHSGAYIALANTELPKEVTLEEIPDRYAKVLIPERMPQPPKAEEKKAEPVAEAKAEKKEPEKKQDSPEQTAQRKAARAAAVAKAVQSKGILKVLGVLGPGGAGKGGGEGGAASIGNLATTGGGKVGLGTKTEVRVSGSVAAEEAEVDSSDIDQGKLGAFVRARMGLIKACYENALKRNPNLKGKISIRFTILETGGLAEISAAVNSVGSPEVAACIVNTMRSWRTQFRPSGPVTVEYPFVFQPVN